MSWEGINGDKQAKDQRKFQCFVCGQLFSDYSNYKEHIAESHEEGREYVICPLERCQAPVRDLKMHFKIKHRGIDLKALKGDYQVKATIWHDFSPQGNKKTRPPKVRRGKYTSVKNGKIFQYRSGLEERVFNLLDDDKDVLAYDVEPFAVDYIFQGTARKYTPDIFVVYVDGHKELWEVKPKTQTEYDQNKAKWDAAKEQCQFRGWSFQIYTEERIDKLAHKIKNQYLG